MAGDAAAVPVEEAAQLTFNVVLGSGTSHNLTAQSSDPALTLMQGLAEAQKMPPYCNVKLFQSGRLILEDSAVSELSAEQPVFAVITRETNLEILLQKAGWFSGYTELLKNAQPDPEKPGTRLVGPMPTILDALEELGGQPPELTILRAEAGSLVLSGAEIALILPSLDATPLLSAAGVSSFSQTTLCIEVNSNCFNRGLGVMLEASPFMETTIDETGLPSYVYGFGRAARDQKKQNFVKFHPGMTGGQLRVEGVGGWHNQHMGFTPKNWGQAGQRYHTLAITVGADGQNQVQFKSESGEVWMKSWQRQLTQGTHIPAVYAWLDLGEEGMDVHFGKISLQVNTERLHT